MLRPVPITSEMAAQILNVNHLPARDMCKRIDQVYIGDQKCEGIYTMKDPIGEASVYGKVYTACCDGNCSYVAKWQPNSKMALNEAKIQYSVAQQGLAPMIREVWVCPEGTIIIMDALSITAKRMLLTLGDVQRQTVINKYVNIYKAVLNKYPNEIGLIPKLMAIKSEQQLFDIRKEINLLLCRKYRCQPIEDIIITEEDSKEEKDMKIGIMNQLIGLLGSLHSMGLVHGDAHLNNFMSKDDKWYLIDFGLTLDDTLKNRMGDYQKIIFDLTRLINDGYENLRYLREHLQRYIKLKFEEK